MARKLPPLFILRGCPARPGNLVVIAFAPPKGKVAARVELVVQMARAPDSNAESWSLALTGSQSPSCAGAQYCAMPEFACPLLRASLPSGSMMKPPPFWMKDWLVHSLLESASAER